MREIHTMKEFFILQNTQSGKLALTTEEIQKWASMSSYKVITFFISSNDRTLIDQSSEGISYFLKQRSNIFVLSSNAHVNLEQIKTRIELYANDRLGRHEMPIITTLANKHQNTRVLELVHFIQQLSVHTPVKYGFIFDEADATYPLLREQNVLVGKKLLHYHSIFVEDQTCLHRVGFVTATEGCLAQADYPECANAILQQCVPKNSENYRAIHTVDAVYHPYESDSQTHNEYALEVLTKNRKHFFGKVKGSYRKVIIHSNALTSEMQDLAEKCVSMGMNALVFNMEGLALYTTSSKGDITPLRGKRFNQTLFEVVATRALDQKPLVIIGRRKVDRGLSFHYAPRDGSKGLIWTDMIMGEVEDLSLAVQKFGRMAGIIAHCPQYTGSCHYWSTDNALQRCIEKNRANDRANTYASDLTLSQALAQASASEERFVEKLPFGDPSLPERFEYYVESDRRSSVNSYRIVQDGVEFYNGLSLDERASIPFVIKMAPEEVGRVMDSVLQRKRLVKEMLLEKYPYLEEDMEEFLFGDCREVNSIDFLIESSLSGRKISYPIEGDENTNVFHILIHPSSCSLAMIVWKGDVVRKPDVLCTAVKSRGKYAGEKCGKKCAPGQTTCAEHSDSDEEDIVFEIKEDDDDIVFEMKEDDDDIIFEMKD